MVDTIANEYRENQGYDLGFLQQRFYDMRTHRAEFEQERDLCDDQFDAALEETNEGKLLINNTMEQDSIEMTVGRRAGQLDFNIMPDSYEPNVKDVDIARHILTKRIEDENTYREVKLRRNDKGRYGSAAFHVGVRYERELVWRVKKDISSTPEKSFGLFDPSCYEESYKETYSFGPVNVPLRFLFVDERALYQSKFGVAVDCFMIEALTEDEVNNRYKGKPWFNQRALETMTTILDDDKAYGITSTKGRVLLYHYYNRETKRQAMMLNKVDKLYEGPQLYKGNPFAFAQHHTDTRFLYGIGICRKVRPWKATKNVLIQGIIDGARLSSGKVVGVGASGEILDGDIWVNSGEVSIVRMTNAIEQTKALDLQVDITQLQAALPIVDMESRVATGVDLNSPFEMPANVTTLGQTEILEENKATRAKTVDENEDEAIDEALTMFLANLQQFMPHLGRTTYDISDEGEDKKVETFPLIAIKDIKVVKNSQGKQIIKEDLGNYGYLEFTPDTIKGNLAVRVVTPSTYNRTLSIIEKSKRGEMVDKYALLAQTFGAEIVSEEMGVDYVLDKMKIVFGYGSDEDDMAMSKKQQNVKNNQKLLKGVYGLFDTQMSNAAAPQVMGEMPEGNLNQQLPPVETGEGVSEEKLATAAG